MSGEQQPPKGYPGAPLPTGHEGASAPPMEAPSRGSYPQSAVPWPPAVEGAQYPIPGECSGTTLTGQVAYPPQGTTYPPQAATAYPPQAATAYPPQAATAYPPQAATAYPPQAATAYPPQTSAPYPSAGGINPYNVAGGYHGATEAGAQQASAYPTGSSPYPPPYGTYPPAVGGNPYGSAPVGQDQGAPTGAPYVQKGAPFYPGLLSSMPGGQQGQAVYPPPAGTVPVAPQPGYLPTNVMGQYDKGSVVDATGVQHAMGPYSSPPKGYPGSKGMKVGKHSKFGKFGKHGKYGQHGKYKHGKYKHGKYKQGKYKQGKYKHGKYKHGKYKHGKHGKLKFGKHWKW